MTPGHYLRQCREAAGLSALDLALRLDTVPPVSARRRAEMIADVEAGLTPITPGMAIVHATLYPIDGCLLDQLLAAEAGELDEPPAAGWDGISVIPATAPPPALSAAA